MAALSELYKRFSKSLMMQALQQGLVMNIPLLTIGSFAMILQFLPIFSSEPAQMFFLWINHATFGILGIACTISISYCYARLKSNQTGTILGNIFAAVSASLIFNGFFLEGFSIASFGTQGMCNSIFSALAVSYVYFLLMDTNVFHARFYTEGANYHYNNALSVMVPLIIVISLAFLFNNFLFHTFSVVGFEGLVQKGIAQIFVHVESTSVRTLLYITFAGFLWFFGIHGINVLNGVDHAIFPGGVGVNVATDAIITKPFMDVFVFMGGCGATISLMVAILLFSKQKTNRRLARIAALPMMFNVNELMLFGLPTVLNPYFILPFMLTPIVFAAIAYVAIWLGLVPRPELIHWITPIILGGYRATGSFSGVVLQLVNIIVGVFIYRWFLLHYECATDKRITSEMGKLIKHIQVAEQHGAPVDLMNLCGTEGIVAKMLVEDLRHVLARQEELTLHYQPQFNNHGQCTGVEALLRWNHPLCGMVYPPLMIGLAKDDGFLTILEQEVLNMAFQDIDRMLQDNICPPKVCINITATTLQSATFKGFLEHLLEEHPQTRGIFCLELTEQMSFMMGESSNNQLRQIRNMGVTFVVDDFSMGHTSLKYLQTDLFDMVKLDGALVADLMNNERSKEIIASIIQMSRTLGFSVLAEYVETVEQQQLLERLGCSYYQGYLYSPAISYEDLVLFLSDSDLGASEASVSMQNG